MKGENPAKLKKEKTEKGWEPLLYCLIIKSSIHFDIHFDST